MIRYYKMFGKRLLQHEVTVVASQLSYYMMLSFFPFMIFLLTLVGYSTLDAATILEAMQRLIPKEAFVLISDTIVGIVDSKSGNLLSFGIVFTIFTGSGGIRAVIHGLNKAYGSEETRPLWKVFLLSFFFLFVLSAAIIGSFLLIVFGQMIGTALINLLKLDIKFRINWDWYRYAFSIGLMFFIFSGMYYFLPAKKLRWRDVLYGSVFCTFGWILSSLGFAYYVNNFSNYSNLYGSLGAVIILMTWIYITSIIILIGGEINAFLVED